MVIPKLDLDRDEEFERYLFDEDLKFMRKMLLMGIFLYASFGLVDRFINVDNLFTFTLIRFGIVTPLIAIVLLLSFHKSFYILHQYLLSTMFTVAGIGIVVMLTLAPTVFSYYGGLFLVFGYAYFLIRIKWQFAVIGSTIILITYFILGIIHLNEYMDNVLVFSLFYMAFNIIAGFSGYTFSTYRKHRYNEEKLLKGDKIIMEKQIYDNLLDIETSNYITIYSLAKLAESRDQFTGEHIDRVGHLCFELAKRIPESVYVKNSQNKEEFIRSIELASTLHDIGKIGIPETILMKPGKLTTTEFKKIKEHCTLGSSTLREIQNRYAKNDFINMGIEICESHHENWDGTGYPRNLKGKDIPFSARLVAVIDVYDALISERPYKKAWSVNESLEEISKLKGSKFDVDIVKAFVSYKNRNK